MYAVGIDVSKGKSTVSIITTSGKIIEKPFEITHDQEGFNTLISKIENINKEEIKFLMEATGHYHLPILNALIEKAYFVSVENALVIKKYCDMDLRKVGYEITKSIKSCRPKTDNAVYLFMLRKESEGKNKTSAKIAGLNKFLRIYYARVKELYN